MRVLVQLSCLLTGASAGCAAFDRPAIDLVPETPTPPPQYQALAASMAAPMDNWLDQFGDPALETLITDALAANPGLRVRLALAEAAADSVRATRGRIGPSVDASSSASLSTLGTDRFDDPSTTLGLGLNASWEADLWGRLRASVSAAQADLAVSQADYAAAELSLAGQGVNAWLDLVTAREQQALAELTLDVRRRTLDLTERRLAQGTVSALDVRLGRSALAQAEGALAARVLEVGNAQRRLEVLLGRYPAGRIATSGTLPALDPIRTGGDPVMLLSRRPDLASAEAEILAAGLRAEIARLALRPSLRLSASMDMGREDFSDLFDVDTLLSRVAAGVAQPLFNGGALSAEADAALARARAALAQYTATALNAWREVEDALQADGALALQEAAQRRSLEEATLAERIAEREYAAGLTTIFNLIDAQDRRLSAEGGLISIKSARAANRVRYHVALGGGVPVRNPEITIPATTGTAGGSQTP
jgi:NodT family efflux transporter outer membrane factor (OMF) lipoprotein